MRFLVLLLLACTQFGCATPSETPQSAQAHATPDKSSSTSRFDPPAIKKPIQSRADWEASLIGEISKQWIRPPTVKTGLSCSIRLALARDGRVRSVVLEKPCGGTEFVNMMLVAAAHRASPLSVPDDDSIFVPELLLELHPK